MKTDKYSGRSINLLLKISSVIILCIMLSANCIYASDLKMTIQIGGTGTALGSFSELADAYMKIHPDINIIVLPSLGSTGGIKAVNEGAIDIGLSSRPLKDTERHEGTIAVEYARTPFVFVTAQRKEALRLSLTDIAGIFSGEISKWPDGTIIRLVLRPESDMDTILVQGMSPEMNNAVRRALSKEGMMVAFTDQDSADAVEKIRGAFGTSTLAQIISEKRGLTPVTLNGVVPDMKSLADGSYKYYKTLYLVTGPKSKPAARDFLDFINSGKGREVLSQTGHLPL
ncbi:MAG: substrate-binding domain-containing protein [Nitrospirota bacterium]